MRLMLAAGAVLVGSIAAIVLLALQLKLAIAIAGALGIVAACVITRRPRQLLLFVLVALVPIDAQLVLNFREHLGGAWGVVIWVPLMLLVPLAILAVMDHVAASAPRPWRLGRWTVLVPLLPIVASLPSFMSSRDLTLSSYELLRMLAAFLIYLYFAVELRPGDLRIVVVALFAGLLAELPFALLQFATGAEIKLFGLESGTALEDLGSGQVRRVSGTLIHPNLLASYVALLFPMTLVFAVRASVPGALRALAVVASVAGLVLLLLSFSRGAWVGVVVALPVALFLAARFRHLTVLRTVVVTLALAVAAAMSLALPPVFDRLTSSDPTNLEVRFYLNDIASDMWRSAPVIGVGLNTFTEIAVDFDVRHVSTVKPALPAHNIYLLWLAEIGAVGALGMAVFVAWSLFQGLRAARLRDRTGSLIAVGFVAGVIALYVGEIVSFSTKADPVMQMFFILLGIMVALLRIHGASPDRARAGAAG